MQGFLRVLGSNQREGNVGRPYKSGSRHPRLLKMDLGIAGYTRTSRNRLGSRALNSVRAPATITFCGHAGLPGDLDGELKAPDVKDQAVPRGFDAREEGPQHLSLLVH